MLIWTIQPVAVWKDLQERRTLHVDPQSDEYGGYTPHAYQWLQSQLSRRLRRYDWHLPWWAYCIKPDLRLYRHRVCGEQVRLELEPESDRVVRFPCWAWDTVFRQDYLGATRAEYEAWWSRVRQAVPDEDCWPLPEPWRGQLEKSWERLFDPDLPLMNWDRDSGWFTKPCVEAVFEVLRIEDMRQVTLFQGTARPLRREKRPAGNTLQR